MGKKSGSQKNDNRKLKSGSRHKYADDPVDMDDEIDVFHKQRDVVPLDLNDDFGESSDDNEQPVLEDEDIKDDTSDEDEDEDVEDEDEDVEDEDEDVEDDDDKGFEGKLKRQLKYMQKKFPGVGDEMQIGEEDEEEQKGTWTGRKGMYHGGDNRDIDLQSSDEEELQEEEAEVVRLQKEKAKLLSMADFGLEDASGDDGEQEPSLEKISVGRKSLGKGVSTEGSGDPKELHNNLNTSSREEQMNLVYSSAPELVGLLDELNDALEQLETRINPVLRKAKESGVPVDGGLCFLEKKQLLLMAYCQAITFYLLLKSEGLPVHDHPVIGRLVEIKGLLDKMEQLGGDFSSKLEEYLKENENVISEDAAVVLASELTKEHDPSLVSAETREVAKVDSSGSVEGKSSFDHLLEVGKHKRKNDAAGVESTEMLRIRAILEDKLKQKGVFGFVSPGAPKVQKKPKLSNGRLETRDDFDDDAVGAVNGNQEAGGTQTKLYSQKLKVISGDEDIPMRDDIGERRRKHEMRVLATAGVQSANEKKKDEKKDAKAVAAPKAEKAEKRNPVAAPPQSLPETMDGKRLISYQMEKNRGLTRNRKKSIKNPRKRYRTQHETAEKRRRGQVVSIKKPLAPYGGEASGINTGISRSIRM